MTSFGVHGTCRIETAQIRKNDGQNFIDITPIVTGMFIKESIYETSMYASIIIYDMTGLLENMPIIGEEILWISLNDPMMQGTVDFEFCVSGVRSMTILPKNDGIRYILDLYTRTTYGSKLRNVISYFESPASVIAKDIFDQTYETINYEAVDAKTVIKTTSSNGTSNYNIYDIADGRRFTVEETESVVRCIIPNYTPETALQFLSNRSISHENSPSCSFKFFETKVGYFFVTDEFLVRQAVNKENGSDVKKLYFNPTPDIDPTNINKQITKIKNLEVLNYVDTLDDLYSGAYNAKVLELDVLYGKLNEVKFTYEDAKKLFTGMNGKQDNSNSEKHSENFMKKYFVDENQKIYTFMKDYDTYNDVQLKGEQFIPKLTLNRLSYTHRLNSTRLKATIDGRLDICAGDVISLNVTKLNSGDKSEKSEKFSGNFLVTDVSHSIDGAVLTTEFIMSRFGWGDL